jgi:hypothetical protein
MKTKLIKTKHVLLALALGLGIAGAANAQVISYSPRSGDVWVDSELGYMNGYGRNYNDNFVDDIVSSFGAPRYLVNDLLTTRRWNPGDVYYACALAYQTRRPCGDVVNMYDQNRGQGWGVVAQRMGIKPGSAEFHALKGQLGKAHGRYSSYSSAHPIRISTEGPGNSGNAHGNSGNAPGNSGKAKGKGNGKENGQGKGKNH